MTHLSNEITQDERRRLTQLLLEKTFTNVDEVSDAIDVLGDVKHRDATQAIEHYLDHPNYWVRHNAIMALALEFKDQRHRSTCQRMIELEDEEDVRRAAVTGYGALVTESRDLAGAQYLASLVQNRNLSLWTREAAYQGILYALGVHPREHPHLVEDDEEFRRRVDWNLLERIAAGRPVDGLR
jgi:HEAT repeat protein